MRETNKISIMTFLTEVSIKIPEYTVVLTSEDVHDILRIPKLFVD